jgi:UDP-4-amino-4,6-dideoxy-N-acetyl-beta-L-altrosamine N-acetyltransferase
MKVREEDLEMVLSWRTSPDVTRHMLTDIEFSLEKQHEWFEKTRTDTRAKHWVVCFWGKPVGLAYLSDIDYTHRRCSWGFYIGESDSRFLGTFIPPYIYNYVFNKMKFHKIVGEVLDGNLNIMKMHAMHGCRIVGTQKDQIFKYGKFHDLHLVELLASDWDKRKSQYGGFITEFEE